MIKLIKGDSEGSEKCGANEGHDRTDLRCTKWGGGRQCSSMGADVQGLCPGGGAEKGG
jgi:hypothetical protein